MDPVIQILIDYVEGKLDIKQFKCVFEDNYHLQDLLKRKIDPGYEAYNKYDYNIYTYILQNYSFRVTNWDIVSTRYILYLEIRRWLDWFHISYRNNYTKYADDYSYILAIQPSWLDITDDQGIFDKILAERPKELSKTKQIAWGKAKLKELFKYDKTYPRWVQDPEWPIVNGKPLVFSHQSKEKKDDARVYYYFYDPDTKEQTVVEQLY